MCDIFPQVHSCCVFGSIRVGIIYIGLLALVSSFVNYNNSIKPCRRIFEKLQKKILFPSNLHQWTKLCIVRGRIKDISIINRF